MKNLEQLRQSILLLFPDEWLKEKVYSTDNINELDRTLKHLQKLKCMNEKERHDFIENQCISYYKEKGHKYIKLNYSLDNYIEWTNQFKDIYDDWKGVIYE